MARNKLTINFDGFKEMAERLDKIGGDLKKTTEQALEESAEYMTPNIQAAISPHRLTGQTESSLVKSMPVKWEGNKASRKVGFNISDGGLASIFLMYGTPKMAPDRKLYNSVYGTATRKKIAEIQKKIFIEELQRLQR